MKEPWEDPLTIWRSKPAFFSWLRGQMRRSWTKYPVKNNFLRKHRFRACVGVKDRDVWACRCAKCKKVFPQSKVQVDHIIPAGSLNEWNDLQGFTERLFTTSDNLRFLCNECHELITYAYIYNNPEKEVGKYKMAVKFRQLKADEQRKRLQKLGYEPASNKEERLEQFKKHMKLK
jgi:hypothetical protein